MEIKVKKEKEPELKLKKEAQVTVHKKNPILSAKEKKAAFTSKPVADLLGQRKKKEGAERYGKYGEIMPEEEFLLLVQACDMFEVVRLDKAFVEKYKEAFAKDPVISDDIVEKIHEGVELSEIETLIS